MCESLNKSYLFIAEKPSAMRAVKDAYEKNSKDIINRVGTIEFVALAGHVCRYLEVSEYKKYLGEDGKRINWKEIPLPIDVPMTITYNGKSGKEKIENIKSKLSSHQYDGIIVGTDSDVEGNGIYWLLSRYLNLDKYETLRFFEQSLTEKEIVKSLLSMTDFKTYPRDVNMTNAYIVRSQFDWAVGMNATVGITVAAGGLCKIGRVKAPTIKLVHDATAAFDNFKEHSDYLIRANYAEGFSGILVREKDPIAFPSKEAAEKYIDGINGTAAIVSEFTSNQVKTPPLQFHKLSTLQVEAGTAYGYNPEKTLSLVQSLYEKHFVSYPRTDGMYLSEEAAKELPSYINNAKAVQELIPFISRIRQEDIEALKADKRFVNDKEVAKASHTALMPEGKPILSSLTPEEANIYSLICRRLIAAFIGNLVEEKVGLNAIIGTDTFRSTSSKVISEGWKELYRTKDKQESEPIPCDLRKGSILKVRKFDTKERKATKPKLLTTATLIDAMENISRYIEDKELRQVMRDAKGIGTPATRASIINDIIDTGYVSKSGKNETLRITPQGKNYIGVIGSFSIVDPAESARIETIFQKVKEGAATIENATGFAKEFVNKFITTIQTGKVKRMNEIVKCPYCDGMIVRNSWGYGCSNWKQEDGGCKFSVNNKEGKITDADIEELVQLGETSVIDGIAVGKNGKPFNAALVLCEKGSQYTTEYKFPDKKSSETEKLSMACPWCSGEIVKSSAGYGCTNWKDADGGCKFFVGSKDGKVTQDHIKELISNGITSVIKDIGVGKSGKPFSAALSLNPKGSAYATAYKFDDTSGTNAAPEHTGIKCPWCGGEIMKYSSGYGCANVKEEDGGCRFFVGNKNGEITDEDIQELVTSGITRKIAGVATGKNGLIDAALKLADVGSRYATEYVYD